MLRWFKSGGVIGILDATNSTKERRKWVIDRVKSEGVDVLFVESKCDDEELIMANIRDVKTTSPDYKGQDPDKAAVDFRERIRNYEKVYKSINADGDEDDLTYLKIMNVGKQVIINRIRDYLQSRIVYYLMNLHIRPRSVWLSRVSFRPCPGVCICTPPPPPPHAYANIRSMASRCSTSRGASEVTPVCRTAARSTRSSCPSWCSTRLV